MAPPPVPPASTSRLPSQCSPRNPNSNLNSVLQDILLDLEDIFLKAVYNGDLRLVKKMVRALDDGEGRIAQKMGAVKHSSFGIGVLHFAALGRSLPMCRYLVEDLRMDVDDICPAGETPLTFAIGFENVDVVRYLLNHDADTEKLNEDGLTPLYVAAAIGQCEIVEVLLSKGAHIDALSTGETALHAAAHGRHDNVVKILLDHCADHNKINFGDCTPLVCAIDARSLKCVKLLLEAGADVNCVGFETPLIVAAGIGLTDILKCLVLAGADPNVHDSFGRTPVEIAACYSTRKDVEILFPVTSRIPSVSDWSVDGIVSYAKPVLPSKEVMLAITKSEACEAYTNTDFLAAVEKYTKDESFRR
ncbi:26S proteasome non-ATPase regulatory subunit 10 isoform X4 [Brachypodium distachyon]|uniref:26S proteasome non-ATPase regulatory subunit 10 isoform X4 n=1 Tax=Brachypodium distachyon TaxID=15368 RepID=UPI0006E47F7F|nr:26S proteasome non-ATPase regulatory subunit 10 isoform X4 [Brachypodium distachyon]|eukprot:XP_024317709.1 26S proteasome non-ATPase regulatory subunit 10 isoform X4 [Brachypodium distachyon]